NEDPKNNGTPVTTILKRLKTKATNSNNEIYTVPMATTPTTKEKKHR
ncbi:19225_t:CDS:1, partial [Gigaspora margarita]